MFLGVPYSHATMPLDKREHHIHLLHPMTRERNCRERNQRGERELFSYARSAAGVRADDMARDELL